MPRARVSKRRAASDDDKEHDEDERKQKQHIRRGGEPKDQEEQNEEHEELPAFDQRTFEHAPIAAANHTKLKAVTDSWDGIGAPLDVLEQLIRDCGPLLAEIDGVDSKVCLP